MVEQPTMIGITNFATLAFMLAARQAPSVQNSPAPAGQPAQQVQQSTVPAQPLPGTPSVTAIGNPLPVISPPPAPTIVNAKTGEAFSLGQLSYRVQNVRHGLASYTQTFDQRRAKLTPGYKADRLVVLDIEVTNNSPMPANFSAIGPSLIDQGGSMTDRAQWDVRQKSFVQVSGNQNPWEDGSFSSTWSNSSGAGPYGDPSDAVMVAPGGTVKFALIFSESATTSPGQLRLDSGQIVGTPQFIGMVTLNQ